MPYGKLFQTPLRHFLVLSEYFSPVRRWLIALAREKSDSVKRWNIFFITISKSPSIHIFVNSPCNKRDNSLRVGQCLLIMDLARARSIMSKH